MAASRWRVTAVPGAGAGPGWRAELLHCRGGRPGEWIVAWGDDGWSVLSSFPNPNVT